MKSPEIRAKIDEFERHPPARQQISYLAMGCTSMLLAPAVIATVAATIGGPPGANAAHFLDHRVESRLDHRVKPMRLGVFLPNWIGDVVMATPALRALRQLAGDDGRLVGVMRPYVADVLSGTAWIDETILYAKKSDDPQLLWRNVKQRLRSSRLDRVVLLTNSFRTAWMAWRSGAPERIGTAGNLRTSLLTTKVFAPRRSGRPLMLPAIDGYLLLATAAGCPPESPELELATTAADEQAADRAWSQLGLPHQGDVVVINSGGAFGSTKDWPAEHFGELARRLAAARSVHVLINCGPSERATARMIVELANHPRVTSLAEVDSLPIGLTKAAIRRSRLVVTTDSGPRFFGIAFGVPTVTLFGSTSTHWTRTYDGVETSLSLDLECQPCMQRQCPLGHHRCMRDLSVDRVLHAAIDALGAVRSDHAA